MSEHAIEILLDDSGETLVADYKDDIINYRVISHDKLQTVVSGIPEAVYWVFPELNQWEALEMISNIAASVSDEIKALTEV